MRAVIVAVGDLDSLPGEVQAVTNAFMRCSTWQA